MGAKGERETGKWQRENTKLKDMGMAFFRCGCSKITGKEELGLTQERDILQRKKSLNTRREIMEKMIMKIWCKTAALCICLFLLLSIVFEYTVKPQEIVFAESVDIVRISRKIIIYDHLSGDKYLFRIRRIKHSEAEETAKTAIETSTIKIDILPGGCLEIYSEGKVYQITPKAGRFREWLRKSQMKNY